MNSYGNSIYLDTEIQPTIKNNIIININSYGVYNNKPASIVIDATLNYWGGAYGPSTSAYYTGGSYVSAGVNYSPYLGEEYVNELYFGVEGVYAPLGNFSTSTNTMTVSGPGFTIDFTITYNSLDQRPDSTLGRGWKFGYESSVKDYVYQYSDGIGGTGYISLSDYKMVKLPDGSTQLFELKDGVFVGVNSYNNLASNALGGYNLTTKDQYVYTYNSNGYLVAICDKNKNQVNINVDAEGRVLGVVDGAGRQYAIAYTNGLITSIVDPIGRTIQYQYENGLLVRVIDPMNVTIASYAYDSNAFLTEIKDALQQITQRVLYHHADGDNKNKVYQITDAYGKTVTYAYDNANKMVTKTDNNAHATVEWFNDDLQIIKTQDPEGKVTLTEYYNKIGDIKSFTDRNGNKVQFEYDAKGNVTKITNPDGSVKIYTYDAKNNRTSVTDETGRKTFYVYDANSNIVKLAQPLNGTDVYASDANGSLFAITQYVYYTEAERNQLGYAAKGLLKSVIDPEGGAKNYTYDHDGNILTVSDPETHQVTTYTYNGIGWVMSSRTPMGHTTTYAYDLNGRVVRVTLGDSVTRYVYDALGRKVQEISPNQYNSTDDGLNSQTPNYSYTNSNVGTRYVYHPAGGVLSQTDAAGYTTNYTYDQYGNILTETKPNGGIYVYQYDVMNRVTSASFKANAAATPILLATYAYIILADGKTQNTVTTYVDDTQTLTTAVTYDYAGRKVVQQNPDGTTVTWQYNGNGTLAEVTKENGAKEYNRYDGLNRLSDKWTSITADQYAYAAVIYDKVGRVLSQKNGIQSVALWSLPTTFITQTFTYYANGLTKTQEDGAGGKTFYYYDNDNHVNRTEQLISSSEMQKVEYVNNQFGKPVYKYVYVRKGDIAGNNFADNTMLALRTDYVYDKNGNLISITTPDGNTTVYSYDKLNRLIGTSTGGQDETGASVQIVTSKTLTWDGKDLTVTDARGNVTQYVYDARGMMIRQINANGGTMAYLYDRVGRLLAVVSPNHYDPLKDISEMNRTTYTYDAMGRVITVSQVYYDAQSGQWTSFVDKANKYDAAGNLIKTLDALGYEAGIGASLADRINSGYGTQYTYDLANRLLTTLDAVSQQRGLPFTESYTYDSVGRKISQTDANAVTTNYTFDDAGRILSITLKNASFYVVLTAKMYTYDKLGRVLTETDANGNVTQYRYNAFNQISVVILPGDETIPSNSTNSQYDNMGRPTRTWDSTGRETLIGYDNQGRVLSKTERKTDGTQAITLTYRYDVNGNLRFAADGNGTLKEYTYNKLNRPLTETVGGKTTTYTYDANGNRLTTTDWIGNTYTNTYDAFNRLVERRDPYNVTIERLEYNRNNVQTATYDALGHGKTFLYDRNNRLVGTVDACGHTTSQTYDSVGNVNTKTDGNNNLIQYYYDEFNRMNSVTQMYLLGTYYRYDGNGNVIAFTDSNGTAFYYEYNCQNLIVKSINPGGLKGKPGNYTYDYNKIERNTYTANGLLLTKTDMNGVTTSYNYDIHGRTLGKTAGSVSVFYTYDNNGNVLSMTDGTGTTTYTYDGFNRVVTKTIPNFGEYVYAYDITQGLPAGYVAETSTDPHGSITKRVYDRAGRLYQVIADGKTTTYTYYANGSLQRIEYDGGASEEYTYYDDNLLHTLVNKKADGTVIDSYSYTYDGAHNMLSKTDAKGITNYTYDALNRLLMVTEPNGQMTSYTFDRAGNRASQTITFGANTTVSTYTYDSQNRLLSVITKANGVTTELVGYTYDNNGNQLVTTKTAYVNGVPQAPVVAAANTYDTLNQLISTVTSSGDTIVNAYNGDGLRVSKAVNGEITLYLYEASRIVLEQDGQGNQTAWNVYGTNLIMRKAGADTLTYMYNGHADVTALLDSNGNLVATYYYDAFGNILEKTGTAENSILYGGYQYDAETGLYYLNARMYDPVTARFLQQDTHKGQYNDPLSLNLYTYCHNEPLMYSDPTGHRELVGASFERETEKERKQSLATMAQRSKKTTTKGSPTSPSKPQPSPSKPSKSAPSVASNQSNNTVLEDLASGVNLMNQIEAEVIFGIIYGALNSTIGLGMLPEFYHNNSVAYNTGKALGDLGVVALGVIGLIIAGGGTVAGISLSATGVGAVIGAPMSAGSLAFAGVSYGAIALGAENAGKDISNAINNSSNIMYDSGTKGAGNIKSVGSNSRANEIAEKLGFEAEGGMRPAEVLKSHYVDDVSHFDIMKNTQTNEIVLQSKNGVIVETGLRLP